MTPVQSDYSEIEEDGLKEDTGANSNDLIEIARSRQGPGHI